MKIMQTLQIRREVVEQNNTLLAAQATLDLRIKELELAQKAIKEAEERLDFIVKESLKKKSLKWQVGELVYVEDVKRLYCYINDDFITVPHELSV
jgi:hypothetical protein